MKEKRLINGVLCWRNYGTEGWTPFTAEELSDRLERATALVRQYRTEVGVLRRALRLGTHQGTGVPS